MPIEAFKLLFDVAVFLLAFLSFVAGHHFEVFLLSTFEISVIPAKPTCFVESFSLEETLRAFDLDSTVSHSMMTIQRDRKREQQRSTVLLLPTAEIHILPQLKVKYIGTKQGNATEITTIPRIKGR